VGSRGHPRYETSLFQSLRCDLFHNRVATNDFMELSILHERDTGSVETDDSSQQRAILKALPTDAPIVEATSFGHQFEESGPVHLDADVFFCDFLVILGE
jgi:hypothetical protein